MRSYSPSTYAKGVLVTAVGNVAVATRQQFIPITAAGLAMGVCRYFFICFRVLLIVSARACACGLCVNVSMRLCVYNNLAYIS